MNIVTKNFKYGDHNVTIQTGEIARQATGSVMVDMEGTIVLVTVVGVQENAESRDFFPLTVNYQEKSYAAGKIPGGYFKREGRPTERETLIARLIDRPMRPLFPDDFNNEVQIVATVLSYNPEVDPDVPAMIGASAAVAISGIPFNGPLGAARVGYKDGAYLLNPSKKQLKTSQLDLVVAGTNHAVLMVESEAKMLSEEIMLGAVVFGHEQMQTVINAINELKAEAGKPAWVWQAPAKDDVLVSKVSELAKAKLSEAYLIKEKLQRKDKVAEVYAAAKAQLANPEQEGAYDADKVVAEVASLEKAIVRGRILAGEPRIDGRDNRTVRPITVKTGVLPRVHGSALFTRGETQALVVTTLGSGRDAQIIDDLDNENQETFMLHYNFPPYSVGEVGFMSGPKRREIGHGRLAKRGIQAALPESKDCPYVLRVVSEITESNGSSSMASVCGTSLALMDAGVKLKAPVSGIAMGLVKEGDRYVVLTDILGDEDHLGDMDFKVAGSSDGITALQMDIKIDGITKEIMGRALEQAKEGRLHILGIMNKELSEARSDISEFAPKMISFKINPDKIRDVIGKGGATIRTLTEETGATVDISDDGVVTVSAVNSLAADDARHRIELLTADVEIGAIYEGRVEKILDFGAIVNILPGKSGLVHISQISQERVENVNDYLQEGQIINVKVLEIDRQGKIRLSMKEAELELSGEE